MTTPAASTRRRFLAAAGLVGWGSTAAISQDRVNPRARASGLRITDLRYAALTGVPMARSAIIRVDTNQGIFGLGEVRDGASPRYALTLKSRLLGENPCDVDRLFRKVKQFGGHGRQGGGVSAVEMALWDLAGKAYDVPAYRLLGGKFRDRVRLYADTVTDRDPAVLAARLRERRDRGFTVLKMDVGLDLLAGTPGAVARPAGPMPGDGDGVFAGAELSDRGVEALCGYVARAREAVGADLPLALDHLGPLSVRSCVRLCRALERYHPAWVEDPVPWQHTELLRELRQATAVPVLTGEDIYLKEGFRRLVEARAVDFVQPDPATAGGLLETKKIADLAGEAGVGTVLHYAGTPVGFMACVHAAAAAENVHSLEYHAADVRGWDDLVDGVPKPIADRGWVAVPDGPGLGVTLNEAACRTRLRPDSGYFAPTPEWDAPDSHDRTWS